MMKNNTQPIAIVLLCCLLAVCAACSKDKGKAALPAGDISIQRLQVSDTLLTNLSIAADTIVVVDMKAMISTPSGSDHHITFAVDNARLPDYVAKYGDATLLPSGAYYFYQPSCSIAAGKTVSDSASEINIVQGTKLKALTTYVLPVVVQSVDGTEGDAAKDQVLFIVVKTGKAAVISKLGWKIQSVSSEDPYNPAINLLDTDDNTLWATDEGMPQYVVLDLDGAVDFSAVTYRTPAPYYTDQGGYARQVKIEISMDGQNWEDKGTYDGQTSDATQVITLGSSTARYLRFTVLSVEPFFGAYNMALIGGIGLLP
ncbi:MAG TPA: discoidin domain-containing protein [Chitinophaga sp.]